MDISPAQSDYLERERQQKNKSAIRYLIFSMIFGIILLILAIITRGQDDPDMQRMGIFLYIMAGFALLTCIESAIKRYKTKGTRSQTQTAEESLHKYNTLEEVVIHYIQDNRKNDKKTLIRMVIFALVLYGIAIGLIINRQSLDLQRDATEIIMTIVYIAVTGVISGMVIYTLKRLKDYRYPERSPLYTLLIHTPHEITRIYEVIHASISAGDRASWGTDTPLSRENTTQSDTQRIGFIDDMKKNGVKVMHSIFYFHYHSTRSPLTLTIPTHEAPYFASMIEKKVPKAKLGYNENYTKNRQNIRKKLSILFLCLFGIVLAGCEKQIAQPIDSDIDYEMGAWFVGDNKYIDEQGDSDTIDTWRKHKLTSIETKGINNDTSNILDGNGPGPNGAQRNGDAPIIVAVLIPMREKDIQKIQISINDNEQPTSLLNALATSGQQTIIYWTMNDREKNLRPIKKDDMITLYGSEKVQAFESDPSSFLTPLNTGEIYTITAHIDTKDGEHTITKVFHIVYGE